MIKNATSALVENDEWAEAMGDASLNGVNTLLGQAEMLSTITPEDIMFFWSKVLSQGNRQIIILNPAE